MVSLISEDRFGQTTLYSYDSDGNSVKQTGPFSGDPDNGIYDITYTYDVSGNRVSKSYVSATLKYTTEYEYGQIDGLAYMGTPAGFDIIFRRD